MNKIKSLLLVPVLLAAGSLAFVGCKSGHAHSSGDRMQYTCSMHPEVVHDTAGNCPKCGMALTEKRR
jgi:hypothetical protein